MSNRPRAFPLTTKSFKLSVSKCPTLPVLRNLVAPSLPHYMEHSTVKAFCPLGEVVFSIAPNIIPYCGLSTFNILLYKIIQDGADYSEVSGGALGSFDLAYFKREYSQGFWRGENVLSGHQNLHFYSSCGMSADPRIQYSTILSTITISHIVDNHCIFNAQDSDA